MASTLLLTAIRHKRWTNGLAGADDYKARRGAFQPKTLDLRSDLAGIGPQFEFS
jgi:hypothetical protein